MRFWHFEPRRRKVGAAMKRVRLPLALTGLMALSLLTGCQEELPPELKGPVSGVQYDCKQAGEYEPAAAAVVTKADLDGDGKDDYVLDYGKSCKAQRELYCNKEGCSFDIYASSTGLMLGGSFKGIAWRAERVDSKTQLIVTRPGENCGKTWKDLCETSYQWSGDAFEPLP